MIFKLLHVTLILFCSLRCDYHEEKETKFCSLGVCNIYTFVAAECLCPKYGVSLTSSHLPKLSVGGTVTTLKMKLPSDEVARDLENEDYPDSDGKCIVCLYVVMRSEFCVCVCVCV